MAMGQERLGCKQLTGPGTPCRRCGRSGARVVRRRGYLDVGALPEHLQRDMGFLDGNDPAVQAALERRQMRARFPSLEWAHPLGRSTSRSS